MVHIKKLKLISLKIVGFICLSSFINAEAQHVFEKERSIIDTTYLESRDELSDYILDTGDMLNIRFKNQPRKVLKEGIKENKSKNDISYLEPRNTLENYILDFGDELKIEFFEVPEFSGTYLIDKNGLIYFKTIENIKELYVRGLTIEELRDLLTERFKEVLISPDINISISDFRSIPAGKFLIDEQGEIRLPEIETDPNEMARNIYVRGLTTKELEKLLDNHYSNYNINTKAFIEIIKYKPIRILVKGAVRNPGLKRFKSFTISNKSKIFEESNSNARPYDDGLRMFPNQSNINNINNNNASNISNQMLLQNRQTNSILNNNIKKETEFVTTLSNAIRDSGGFTSFSDVSKIEIVRDIPIGKGGGKKRAIVNFSSYVNEADSGIDVRLFDGDFIFVPSLQKPDKGIVPQSILSGLSPRFISVSVTGRIENPGVVNIPIEGTLSDAINLTGPRKPLSGKIFLIRYNQDGSLIREKINYSANASPGSSQNPYLLPDDLITVSNSIVGRSSGFIKAITDPLTGIYTTKEVVKTITGND